MEYQYVNKHAFWVFTFTNQILLSNFKDNIKNYNYQKAKEINTLIIDFEEWILNKGIISSITDEVLKENTRTKARSQLRTAKIIKEILDEIIQRPFEILVSKLLSEENRLENFYYLISLYDVSLLDHKKVVLLLIEILNQEKSISDNNVYLLRKLLRVFSFKKWLFIDSKKDVFFSFTTNNLQEGQDKENYSKYLSYSYCEFLLANFLNQREFTNILLGQLLKRWIKNVIGVDLKYDLLLNAYMHFENYQSLKIIDPFFFDSELRIDSKKLLKFQEFDESQIKNWNKIEHSFSAGRAILVRLTKRSSSGFEVVYRGIKGFLPQHKIYDKYLRHYTLETCDFTIEVKCFSYSNLFKFFVVEQTSEDDNTFYVKNNTKKVIGKVYQAIIKRIEIFGYFLSTELGEGLLRVSKILDDSDPRNPIHPIFKENEKIKVVLFQVHSDDKLSFNFSQLKEIDPDYYNDFLKGVFKSEVGINNQEYEELENTLNESYLDKVQEEKASCFEQNALLQTEIEKKIHNFKLARQFYSMTNNAKSFLLNIYTSYFEILLNIKECIHNRSLAYLATIKNDAVRIKKEINTKTIETFPDSEKLINFLEIISLFNENTQASFERLYKFISSDLKSSENTIKAIAKITMANNLLISESQEKENSEFCFKNLSHINNYISNGILSLNETIEDIYAKKQKEQILYWKEKIRGSENEHLELKSSLLKPMLSEENLKRIEILKSASQTESVKKEMSRINGSFAKKAIIHSALKTLAAFANTYGGDLLIGVADDGEIIGLEKDYNTLKLQDQNRDGYGKCLDDLIKTYFGDSFSSLISRKFINFPEGDILIISVRPSTEEIFLLKNEEGEDQEQLYIRSTASSRCLEGSELARFIKTKHLNKIENILHENSSR